MMAAYQPAPSGHPGLPHGHPGMAQNPGQHMGQAMMHPGVSGASHVSQPGAMMGMQPGAGMGPGGMSGQHPGSGMAMQAQMGGQTMAGGMPNAQAMSHSMTPQQMHQQQQQQQQAQLAQMQQNPQLAMQHQQMRLRHQQMLAQQQAQMQGMPQGVQLTPAQMQHLQQQSQMQGGGQVQLPAHLMQQQMQLQRAQQQQMAQQQHAQQQQQQQQQQNHMAQQLAMQHANSQQSNQGQSGPQNPQNTQGQPTNPQQIRPPSRIANPNEQSQQANQPQPHPQQAQGQPGQPQPQQTPQQAQQPNPQQQQQQQQQAIAMQQQRFAIMQRQQQAHTQQMRQMQAQGQAQQAQPAQGGMWILRLMSFGDHLSGFNAGNGKDLSVWQSFVERHFAPEGRLVHSFDDNSSPNGNGRGKLFEVLRPTLPRYFWTYFDSGAHSLRLHTENAREVTQPNGMHLVTCQSAIFSVSYPNGARLEMSGSLHVLFSVDNDTIECFRFQTSGTEEILSRMQIEKVLADYSPSMPTKTSPKMNKKALPKAQQKMQDQQDRLTIDHFPKTPKGTMGFTAKVQQFLEIGETMNVMSDLMHFAQEKKMRPEHALEALVAQYDSLPNGGNPQINYPQTGQAPDSRTPNMQNMQMGQNGQAFNSPSVANLNLPMQANGMNGSPHLGNNPGNLAPNMGMANSHTPSPHQSNMAAPSMMPQHSQQGTNSSVASANTSPNVNSNNNNNKRRRSTVKLEGEDGGGADGGSNANRVRPSPRMSKKAKPQG